jgi:hypothetical protein
MAPTLPYDYEMGDIEDICSAHVPGPVPFPLLPRLSSRFSVLRGSTLFEKQLLALPLNYAQNKELPKLPLERPRRQVSEWVQFELWFNTYR